MAPDRRADPEGYLAVARSHPRWMVSAFWDALAAHRGAERAHQDIDDLLAADNSRPRVTLVVRPGLAEASELVAAGARSAAKFSPYGAYLAAGDPGALKAVQEGRAGVQDEGSQLVATALATAELEGRDERWLDMCAGPGQGRAAGRPGRRTRRALLAAEIAPHRAGLVRKALRSYGDSVQVVAADGIRPPWRPGSFDRVMVDAPCTGLGALRRRPEARWRRAPEDLERLVRVQRRLLSSALDSVADRRPGRLCDVLAASGRDA